VLEPVVGWLARYRVPRLVGTSVVLLTLVGVVGWGAYSLRDDATKALEALPEAARRARALLESQSESGPGAQVQQAAKELRGDEPSPPAGGDQGMSGFVRRALGSVLALAGHTR
jgi:predicted PurR-regulated permease PerM